MVFDAQDIFVSEGVNTGDVLETPNAVCLGDIYELDSSARPLRLMTQGSGRSLCIAAGSDVGQPGNTLTGIARYTLMDYQGARIDLLILQVGTVGGPLLALPLSPVAHAAEYALVNVDTAPDAMQLTDLLCLSFGRGTCVTLADGRPWPIERLTPGDLILTRDHGPQVLRWVGHATLRAIGPFAPVVITAGTMGNSGDLIVSQQHRMFIYQRRHRNRQGPAEVLLQARHLVNDDTIFLRSGGFTDYYALVFDRHEIIYAEGIPVESLLVTDATVSRLPPDLAEEMRKRFPGISHSQHFGTEMGRQVLDKTARTLRLMP
jgi:hypothetical protein